MKKIEITGKMTPFYHGVRFFSSIIFNLILPVKYINRDRARDREEPCVIISNHHHALDPIAVAYPFKKIRATYMGKKEIENNLIGRWFSYHMGMVAVDRHNTDMSAMRGSMNALKRGAILGIFPEGTRHHEKDMDPLESGAFLIALRSKRPIQPVFIDGTLRPFRRTKIIYGE